MTTTLVSKQFVAGFGEALKSVAGRTGQSVGNEKRVAEIFIANFGHWIRGEPMFNVQKLS